ncbi:hypothetical protein P692DRAFT_201798159, partial [Suillus brevipes Sb2]
VFQINPCDDTKSKPTPNLLPVVRSRYYRDVERCQGGSKPDFLEYLPIKCRTRLLMHRRSQLNRQVCFIVTFNRRLHNKI